MPSATPPVNVDPLAFAAFAGIVLAGGRSSRMGADKAKLLLQQQTLLQRIVETIQQALETVIVVAAENQRLPALPAGVRIVRDTAANQGPLQGIVDGLYSLPDQFAGVFVSSCDVPLLEPKWIQFLLSNLGSADIVMPVAQGREHPLSAVYRRSVAATGRQLLEQGRRRPVFLCETHATVYLEEQELRAVDPRLDSLLNVNTPEEYQSLLDRYKEPRRSNSKSG